MTAENFKRWLTSRGLSLSQAAAALGISRRMVAYYKSGAYEIPRKIELACRTVRKG